MQKMKLNIQLFGGRGASSSNNKLSVDISKMKVKDLSKLIYEKTGRNWVPLSDGTHLSYSPTGLWLTKDNKSIATNKKDIVNYIKKNKLSVKI